MSIWGESEQAEGAGYTPVADGLVIWRDLREICWAAVEGVSKAADDGRPDL